MLSSLSSIHTSGSATEGFWILLIIIGLGTALSFKGVRSSIKRTGNVSIGRNPKSKLGQILIGTRKK